VVEDEGMVNGRFENTRAVLYFLSSCANSVSPLAAAPLLRVQLDDALDEPEEEELDMVLLASEAEVDSLLRASSSDETTMGILSRPRIFAPGIICGVYSPGYLTFATSRPSIRKASGKGISSSRIR